MDVFYFGCGIGSWGLKSTIIMIIAYLHCFFFLHGLSNLLYSRECSTICSVHKWRRDLKRQKCSSTDECWE